MNAVLMQNILVSLILVICLLVVVRRLAPNASRQWQSMLARYLGRGHRPRWIRAAGRALQPRAARQGACGSGNGCTSCQGCAIASRSVEASPLALRSRPSAGDPSR
jgi:hypothetical protein